MEGTVTRTSNNVVCRMSGVVRAIGSPSQIQSVSVKEVHLSFAELIIINFHSHESVISAEILRD